MLYSIRTITFGLGLIAAVLMHPNVFAQERPDFDTVEIKTTKVADGIYMLEGYGGNIVVSAGKDGVFLVDDQFSELTKKIKDAIEAITDKPIRFVLNTHYHDDHTDGNKILGPEGVVIIAHDNVRKTLASGLFNRLFQREIPPHPEEALPIITFNDTITFHMNGEEIHAYHMEPSHTNGDSFVHFRKADLIHTGDVFRTTGYPVVDISAGGSFLGIISAHERLLEIMGPDTRLIPGHGVISKRDEVKRQLTMFRTILGRVQDGIDAGLSLEETQAQNPTAEYDEQWGKSIMRAPVLIEVIYNELKNQ